MDMVLGKCKFKKQFSIFPVTYVVGTNEAMPMCTNMSFNKSDIPKP